MDSEKTLARIQDDDELVVFNEAQKIMGDPSVSSAYEDPQLMALKNQDDATGKTHEGDPLHSARGTGATRQACRGGRRK